MEFTNSGVTYRKALEYIGVILPDSENKEKELFDDIDSHYK